MICLFIFFIHDFRNVPQQDLFISIVKQLIPGGILMSVLHLALLFRKSIDFYNCIISKLKCC